MEKEEEMRVAVVGPTGVLGRALVPLLIEKGHTVRTLARSTDKVRQLFPQVAENVECDLLKVGLRDLGSMLQGCDAVAHIATAIPSDFSVPNAMETTARLRTEGVRKLLDASLAAGVRRYVQQSITMAYPDHGDDWITEDVPLDTSPERATTCAPVIAMEEMVREVAPDKLEWSILRCGTFVGPGTFQENRISDLKAGRQVVPCDGSNWESLIHVSDVATAFLASIEKGPADSVFNVVDVPIKSGDYLDRLADSIGAPRPPRAGMLACPPSWRCSNHAIESALQWEPVHGIIPGEVGAS